MDYPKGSGAGMVASMQLLQAMSGNVCIDLGGGEVAMAEQHLYNAQIRAMIEQVCSEGVTQTMGR